MAVIFISYRRDDSRGDTGRLYDRLAEHFDKKQLFRDIDAIAPGERFSKVLDRTLKTCDVLLAVIGPKWLNARKGGRRRLDNPDDFVRQEIAATLERGIPVIPVLVGEASMPRSQDLPEDLAPLASYQAAILHELHFQRDVAALIERIEAVAGSRIARSMVPPAADPERPWTYRDPDWFSDTPERICPPLQIEWPRKVVLYVQGQGPAALAKDVEWLVDEMLQRLWRTQGVILPGVCMSQIRTHGDEYVVRLSGVPVSRGKLSLDDRSSQLRKALKYPVDDLQKATRENLQRIVGHQEVANLVAVHAPDMLEKIIRTSGLLTDLVLVCRALLVEHVSLLPFGAILAAFLRLRSIQRPLVHIVEEIRCLDEVRPLLPANNERHSFLVLSPEFEREIARSLDYSASQPVLARDPERLQSDFASVAAAVQDLQGAVAILVTSNTIRPFVRKFLSLQYPYLWVLSRKELFPKLSGRIIGTVDIE